MLPVVRTIESARDSVPFLAPLLETDGDFQAAFGALLAYRGKLEAAIAVSEALQASGQPQAAEAVLKQSQQVVTPLLDAVFRGENKGDSGFASESAEAAGAGRVDVAELAGGNGGGASELGLWDEAELKRHLAVPFKPLTKRVY